MKFSEYVTEAEKEDNGMSDEEMMAEMMDKNWSESPESVEEACEYMKEMSKTDNKKSSKFLKEMDDYTTSLKESYAVNKK